VSRRHEGALASLELEQLWFLQATGEAPVCRRQTPQREQQRFALRDGESTADEAMDFVAAMTTPRSSCAARIDGNPKV
jgi:hypothetical protein